MTKQFLLGFRLSHEDGSKSRWVFVNDNEYMLNISIRLNDGSRHHFSEELDHVHNWARNRHLNLEICQFETRGCDGNSWTDLKFEPVTGTKP